MDLYCSCGNFLGVIPNPGDKTFRFGENINTIRNYQVFNCGRCGHITEVEIQMDVEYLEMCPAAEEIQEQWKPKKGDNIFYGATKSIEPVTMSNAQLKRISGYHYKQMGFWIPGQEDLQAIVIKKMGVTLDLVLYSFMEYYSQEYGFKDDLTMIWFHFVMWKCYNKEYDVENKKWVKKNEYF